MNAITPSTAITPDTLERVLGHGDLQKLTPTQRVEYLTSVCASLGLNPLTRPIRLMEFQGKTVPYATRDCADQLRKRDGISLSLLEKKVDGDLFVVTARATDKTGRTDEDMGAVVVGHLKGEARANAILKTITKAKRRVTLSICGLGFLDETEVEDIPGARVIDEGGAGASFGAVDGSRGSGPGLRVIKQQLAESERNPASRAAVDPAEDIIENGQPTKMADVIGDTIAALDNEPAAPAEDPEPKREDYPTVYHWEAARVSAAISKIKTPDDVLKFRQNKEMVGLYTRIKYSKEHSGLAVNLAKEGLLKAQEVGFVEPQQKGAAA